MKVFVKRKELVQPRRPDLFVFYAPHITFITDSFVDTFHIIECFIGEKDNRRAYTYF